MRCGASDIEVGTEIVATIMPVSMRQTTVPKHDLAEHLLQSSQQSATLYRSADV